VGVETIGQRRDILSHTRIKHSVKATHIFSEEFELLKKVRSGIGSQCFGSTWVQSRSGSESRSRDLMSKNEKNVQLKNNLIFFDQKLQLNYPYLYKGRFNLH
jgi:hypothetical protein